MKFNQKTHYLTALLVVTIAIPFFYLEQPVLGVTLILLACLLFLQVRFFLSGSFSKLNSETNQPPEVTRPKVFSSIDELASGIAHEINNPLAIIAQEATWIDTLLRKKLSQDSGTQNEIEDCLDSSSEIQRQVERCNLIITKLLSMARELNIVVQKIDINEVTKTVYEIVTREESPSSIEVTLDLDPSAPVILSDGPLIRQVLLNILMNAKQAVGDKGIIKIKTSLRENNWVDIAIQDNGCGISEENIQKIFRPFFSTKKGKGTGLGLAICRGVIDELGGRIEVKSRPDAGTLFTVSLPLSLSRTRDKLT
jgi:two-component system, NtrC family, sensor kinase